MPTLLDLVTPPPGKKQAERRVILTSERHGGEVPWLVGTYNLMQETPYTFTSVAAFNCQPNRGQAGNPLMLVNHWLRSGGAPDPAEVGKVNSQSVLTARLEQCISERDVLPNVLAVDFYGLADTLKVTSQFNAAIAHVTGTTAFWDAAVATADNDPAMTAVDRTTIDQLFRLPSITDTEARALLGPVAAKLQAPDLVGDLERIDSLGGAKEPDVPVPSSPYAPTPSATATH
ncbi:MAG: hypothetical protein JO147_09395 [Actinobacteria bacterium]|nr:hypothetical protein [Actinomycetota bacterium]